MSGTDTVTLPLSGLKVVDLGIITAGAGCSALLGDFGAEVLKVESGAYPDPFRFWSMGSVSNPGSSLDGSAPFNAMNRNKLGVCLDLKTAEGRDAVLRLVASADIVVENFRRGVLDRLGLAITDLLQVNPRIVLVSITSQGDTGPERSYGSYGSTLEAISGLMSVSGYDAETPRASGADVNYPDQHGALLAAGLTLAAVMAARRTGQGRHLVLSQREMVTGLIGEDCLDYAINGRIARPLGNRHSRFVPHGVFPCAGEDNWIAIAITDDAAWTALADEIGGTVMAPELARAEGRRGHEDEIETSIADWTAAQDKHELARRLQAVGVAAAPVLNPAERHAEPHFVERGFFHTIEHPVSGKQIHRGTPFRLKGVAAASRRAPLLGEHTRAVLAGAGFSAAELAELDAKGITRNTR